MIIREITNDDLLNLLPLVVAMYKNIDPNLNMFGAINALVHEINTEHDVIIVGAFKNNKLVGFISGHCFSKKQFHFSGIYVTIKNNNCTKQLIEHILSLVREKGYSAWSVDTTNGNISSIVEKYGAKPLYTRYIKEI